MVTLRNPWVFQDLMEEMDRMSRNAGWAFGSPLSCESGLEVREDEASLRLELPGVSESDLDLVLEEDLLRIEARREDLHHENEEVLLRERSYGEFSREVRLPWRVQEKDVEADLKQGVLHIRLKRAPEAAPRQIKVKSS